MPPESFDHSPQEPSPSPKPQARRSEPIPLSRIPAKHHALRRVSAETLQLYIPRLIPWRSLPPNVRHVVSTFGLAGWIGFWSQVVLAGLAVLTLLLAIPGRALGSGVNVPGSGLSIGLAGVGLLWLGFSIYWGFRYTRVPWRLRAVDPFLRPSLIDTVKVLRWGMWVDMVGTLIALVGVEVSVFVLLAKSLAQPQGVAIYDPLRIIRPLDVLIVLSNVQILAGFVVGLWVAIWLLHDLHRDG